MVVARIQSSINHIRVGTKKFDFAETVECAREGWCATNQALASPTNGTVLAALLGQGHSEHVQRRSLYQKILESDANIPDLMSSVFHYKSGNIEALEMKIGSSDIMTSTKHLLNHALDTIEILFRQRTLYITKEGRLAPGGKLLVDDCICILHGSSNPVALRDAGQGRFYVQEICFLEDWMDPWVNGKVDWKEDEAREFVLI